MAEQVEPLGRAVLRADAVAFLVAGEQHDDVALRLEPGGAGLIIAWVMATMPSFMSMVPRP